MTYDLKSAGTIRELKAMLDRVQEDHLDLPLQFLLIDRGSVCDLQHLGRAAISDDAVPGDKAAFVRPSVGTPAHAVILFSFDAAAEAARESRPDGDPTPAIDYFLAEARR